MGLWRGANINIIRGSVLTATKMATYDHFKHFLLKRGFKDDMLTFFYCSLITGFNLTMVTAPLDLIKTRIMATGRESAKEVKIRNVLVDVF